MGQDSGSKQAALAKALLELLASPQPWLLKACKQAFEQALHVGTDADTEQLLRDMMLAAARARLAASSAERESVGL